jgi:hypothetical protein
VRLFLNVCRCRYLKRRISIGTAANPKGDRVWLKHVDPVVKDFNDRLCKGTNFKRSEVNKGNELEVLAQRLGVKDVTHVHNTRLLRGLSDRTLDALKVRFRPKQKVLLASAVNYETGARLEAKAGKFGKKSLEGYYSTKIYTVSEAFLKANDTHYIITYKLRNLHGVFFEQDLIPANYSGSGPEADLAAQEVQAERERKLRKIASDKRKRRAAERK